MLFRKADSRLSTHDRSGIKLTASPKGGHSRRTGVSPRRPHWKRLPQEPRSDRPGSSRAEAAAFVADRARGKSAARGGTESRRGYRECKARGHPEPLEKPRSSWTQRASAVRGQMRQRSSPEGPRPLRGSVKPRVREASAKTGPQRMGRNRARSRPKVGRRRFLRSMA